MAPWRKVVTVGLAVIAVVMLILSVTGGIHRGAALIAFAVIVVLALVMGPRSPLFRR